MPCNDYPRDYDPRPSHMHDSATKAYLCGILRALESYDYDTVPRILDRVDWKEVGFTRKQFHAWYDNHLKEDFQRREREAKEREKEKILQKALNKLTPEERKVLGLTKKRG